MSVSQTITPQLREPDDFLAAAFNFLELSLKTQEDEDLCLAFGQRLQRFADDRAGAMHQTSMHPQRL